MPWPSRLRQGLTGEPGVAILALEALGAGLLVMGGWMGGTLVTRNLIGVDHRYAQAGRWRESRVAPESGSFVVAQVDELEVDQMTLVRVDGRRIVVGRTEKGYVAFDDECTHRGGSLAGGVMLCGVVQCLWHGSQFDARTGAVQAGPARAKIQTYEIEERDRAVRLRMQPSKRSARPVGVT